MTSTATTSELVYDPYDHETIFNPHAVFRRLRDEAPLYYSEQYGFYAVSRFEDVERTLVNRETFVSCKGVTLDMLKVGHGDPAGHLDLRGSSDARDPPRSACRGCSRRGGSGSWSPTIRRLCVELLDPLVGAGGFDFVADLGSQVPMRVIGMLLGIPEATRRPCATTSDRTRADDEAADARRAQRRHLRGVHRLAGRASLRRHHDAAVERGVRGRERRDATADPRRAPRLRQHHRRRRERDHQGLDRLDGQAPERLSGRATVARRGSVARAERGRGDPALRAQHAAELSLRRPATSSTTGRWCRPGASW